ncbi:twin-arginine translocation signal domain-containing protein [Mesorhizobium sp. NZP2077]|uniref:twin-arginine translocation signal domain-containing protein n=1 Tax=Mesorhizobium sp. NZP2077 TaxID=2483404 RepID=UPI002484D4D8|nr:twin-arginine translocation signal domain-containing protein [Mesorhizobium sp. NZP2077]
MNRRRFMQATSSAIAVGALSSAFAQSSGQLRVSGGGEASCAIERGWCLAQQFRTTLRH